MYGTVTYGRCYRQVYPISTFNSRIDTLKYIDSFRKKTDVKL